MKISFVIPAYNEEKLIERCLRSVSAEIARSGHTAEIIVADNNSTDRTREIAMAFPDVRIVHEPQKGANRARQAGFNASKGEFVVNIDADTIVPKGWLDHALGILEGDDRVVALSGPFIFYDLPILKRTLAALFVSTYPAANFMVQHVLRIGALLQGGNYVVRREALQKIGGHDTTIEFYGDDTDLARRLSKVGHVKWTLDFPMYASGRRLEREGMAPMAWKYAINFFSVNFAGKPVTKEYIDVRPR